MNNKRTNKRWILLTIILSILFLFFTSSISYSFSVINSNQEFISDSYQNVTLNAEVGNYWFQTYWAYAAYLLVFLIFLYIIRKYEKNRQTLKHRAERNEYLEGILQNAPFAIAVTDNDGKVTTINKVFERIFGYSKNDIIDKNISEIVIDKNKNSNEEHKQIYFTGKRKRKDGELVDIELFTSPNQINGKQFGYLLFYNDITKRLQVEADLKKTQQNYYEILDTLQDNYFEVDRKGVLTYTNNAMVASLGFTEKSDIIGKNFRNFAWKDSVIEIYKKFKQLYDTNKPLDGFEFNYKRRDGKVFIGETTVSPMTEGDKIVGSRGLIRDVTERKNAEREILKQKTFLDSLVQQSPFAIVINDMQNKVTVVNPAFEKLFGYKEAEVLGKDLDDLISTPEIRKEMKLLSQRVLKERIYLVSKRKRIDNTLVDVEIIAEPFFVANERYGYLVFYNDISERLKAEEDLEKTTTKLRDVLDTLQDAYFEADPKGILTFVNQAFVNATRYSNREEIIGKHFRTLVSPKTIRTFFQNFVKLYKTNRPIEPFDLIYITKDGQEFASQIVVSPIIEDGRAVGTRGIIRDISVRVKAEEVLREAKEAAEYRVQELASINRVAEKVSYSLDLQDILNSVCKELTNIFPVRHAGISLLNQDKTTLEILAFYTTDESEPSAIGKVLPLEVNSEAQNVIMAKEAVVIEDAQNDPRLKPIHDFSKRSDTRAYMLVPLITRGIAIGTIGMPANDPAYKFSKNELELAETIASQIATAVENARLHEQTEKALDVAERDLEIGRQIQSGFFPRSLPQLNGWEISSYFKPARQVSGDFYDVFAIEDTDYVTIVVADVCDKGVGAALFMVLLRSLIRAYSEQHKNTMEVKELLANVAVKVNNYIVNIHGQSNMFATVVLGILDSTTNKFYYVNGGQEPPIIVNAEGKIKQELEPTGPAFGFTTDIMFDIETIEFSPGDVLLTFTDGLTEAKNAADEFYTDERLQIQISKKWSSAFSMVKHLENDVFSHIGYHQQFDDITYVAVRRSNGDKFLKHTFNQKADMDNLPFFRQFVVDACKSFSVEEEIIETYKLAIDEVCSNLIMHGYEGMTPGNIGLSVYKNENKIVVTVEDTGHSFDPSTLDSPDLSDDIDERKIGGLGVYFVKEMVDELAYESSNGVNMLSLKMNL